MAVSPDPPALPALPALPSTPAACRAAQLELAELDRLASRVQRIVPAVGDAQHRGRCSVCMLGPDVAAELERAWLAWEPTADLAALYDVPESSIRRHATWYSLPLFRAANVRLAYARAIAAGLSRPDAITPEHALRALERLDELTAAGEPGGARDPQVASVEPSWEAEVRLAQRGTGYMPSAALAGQVGGERPRERAALAGVARVAAQLAGGSGTGAGDVGDGATEVRPAGRGARGARVGSGRPAAGRPVGRDADLLRV